MGQPPIISVLLASNVGLTLQALFTGSCLKMVSVCCTPLYRSMLTQQVRTYFETRHDSLWARLGIIWITVVLVFCVVTGNVQQSMVIVYHERFTAWQYQDFVSATYPPGRIYATRHGKLEGCTMADG